MARTIYVVTKSQDIGNWLCVDGLVQEGRNSNALAMELRLLALTHRYVSLLIEIGIV